ncbi:hypothetical protein LMG33818_001972 [Halomonadaceae bacterium LMG 33818]|uniref:I78 family peptidase inhibitor n=1 Tax=Cernens ardua TaxID=3402176 RepID=UPI003EDC8D6D
MKVKTRVSGAVVATTLLFLGGCASTSTQYQETDVAPEGANAYSLSAPGSDQAAGAYKNDPQALVSAHCDAQSLARYNGQHGTSQLYSQMMQQSGASIQRILTPQSIMTMDYRNNRLDIRVDNQGNVLNATCG